MIKQAFRLIYVEESKAHSYEIFLISLLLIIIVCIAGNFEDLQIMLTQPGNCYAETIFCYLAQTGFLIPLTMLISAFCSSTMFIRDKLTGFIRFIVLRIPLHTYAIARAWECFLKAFLCIFISAIIPLVAYLCPLLFKTIM